MSSIFLFVLFVHTIHLSLRRNTIHNMVLSTRPVVID
jgi:hypothetical protein